MTATLGVSAPNSPAIIAISDIPPGAAENIEVGILKSLIYIPLSQE